MDHRRLNKLQHCRRYSCRLTFRVAARRRQLEEETRAATRDVLRADLTPVRFDNGPDDGQSHPHSGLLGGKEMIEHFVRSILGQAGAEIADTDFRALAVK